MDAMIDEKVMEAAIEEEQEGSSANDAETEAPSDT